MLSSMAAFMEGRWHSYPDSMQRYKTGKDGHDYLNGRRTTGFGCTMWSVVVARRYLSLFYSGFAVGQRIECSIGMAQHWRNYTLSPLLHSSGPTPTSRG